jgi:sigma-B regulation protein RsbU (phosphoserine phosphatase)
VFQANDDEWCAIIGDVCGKGAAAARLTALARYTFRATATRALSLATNFVALNDALLRQSEQDRERGDHRFATATAIRFHAAPGGLRVAAGSAGHPPPLIVTSTGNVTPVACRGSLLGMFDRVTFTPTDIELPIGDTLVMYTDGVIEARGGREEFGEDRLVDLLREHAGQDAAGLAAAVEDAVLRFQDGSARDDVAVIAVRAVDEACGEHERRL